MLHNSKNWIVPDWPAPANVRALCTLRTGAGQSVGPFASFNFGVFVGDDPNVVLANRAFLKQEAHLPSEPLWLNQVHGIKVVDLADYKNLEKNNIDSEDLKKTLIEADASFACEPGLVCAVTTADCIPVLLCNVHGTKVAAVHAGWRGLAAGVIENAIENLKVDPKDLLVWLGPAIGPKAFEVGQDVKDAFNQAGDEAAFQEKFVSKLEKSESETSEKRDERRWLADLYLLARLRLQRFGLAVDKIYGGNFCTFTETDRFYSYRRAQQSGRMATLVWMV